MNKIIKWLRDNFLWLTLFIAYDNVFKDNKKPMWIVICVLVVLCLVLEIATRIERRKYLKKYHDKILSDKRYMKEIHVIDMLRLLKLTEDELDEVIECLKKYEKGIGRNDE